MLQFYEEAWSIADVAQLDGLLNELVSSDHIQVCNHQPLTHCHIELGFVLHVSLPCCSNTEQCSHIAVHVQETREFDWKDYLHPRGAADICAAHCA